MSHPDVDAKPPPVLDSIPVELFDSIASLVGRSEHLALCRVSFRLLELASSLLYPESIDLDSKQAASFVSSRVRVPLSFVSFVAVFNPC